MKPENEKLVNDFLAHADDLGDEITGDVREMLGVVPFIFDVMRKRPEVFALSALADYRISRPGSLDPETAELVAVAAAAGAGAENCLKVHMGAALKEGASPEQVLDVLLIAGMIGKTGVLASSLRQFRDVCDRKRGWAGVDVGSSRQPRSSCNLWCSLNRRRGTPPGGGGVHRIGLVKAATPTRTRISTQNNEEPNSTSSWFSAKNKQFISLVFPHHLPVVGGCPECPMDPPLHYPAKLLLGSPTVTASKRTKVYHGG